MRLWVCGWGRRKRGSLAGTPGETPLFTKLSYLAMTGSWKPALSYLVLNTGACLTVGIQGLYMRSVSSK